MLPGIAPVGLPNATAGPMLARNAADLARTNDAYDRTACWVRAARSRTGRASTTGFAAYWRSPQPRPEARNSHDKPIARPARGNLPRKPPPRPAAPDTGYRTARDFWITRPRQPVEGCRADYLGALLRNGWRSGCPRTESRSREGFTATRFLTHAQDGARGSRREQGRP